MPGASHFPHVRYNDPDLLEFEKERLFCKDWLIAGWSKSSTRVTSSCPNVPCSAGCQIFT